MNKKYRFLLNLFLLFFFMVSIVDAAPPTGKTGWVTFISDYIGEDDSCGPGLVKMELELAEYGTNDPVVVNSSLFASVSKSNDVYRDSIFGAGPIIGPICMDLVNDYIIFDIDGGLSYYDVWNSISLVDPTNTPAERHYRQKVWLEKRTEPIHYTQISPVNAITRINPEYRFSINEMPSDYGATGISDAVFFLYEYDNSIGDIGSLINARTISMSGGVGEKNISPVTGLGDGVYTWGAYLNLNGTSNVAIPPSSATYTKVLKSTFMSFDFPFMLDTTPPTINYVGNVPTAPNNEETFTITGEAIDSLSGMINIKIYVDGSVARDCYFATPNSASCDIELGPFPVDTTLDYFVVATDRAGNSATSTSGSVTVVATPPSLPDPVGEPITCENPSYTVLSTASAVNTSPDNGTPQTQVIVGNYMYVGASGASAGINSGMYVYDISDINNVTQVSFFSTSYPESVKNNTWGNSAIGIDVVGNYAYLATYYGGLVIVDVSDPTNPIFAGKVALSGESWEVEVRGNYAFMSAGSGMRVIDVSDKTNPVQVASLNLGAVVSQAITLSGDYAFLAMRDHGLAIVDISNPLNPVEVSQFNDAFNSSNWAYDVVVNGNYLYVANHYGGTIRIYDISDLTTPTFVSSTPVPGSNRPRVIHIEDNVMYVGSNIEGGYVFDLSTPTAPSFLHRIDEPTLATNARIWDFLPVPGSDFTETILISQTSAEGVYVVGTECEPPVPETKPDLVAASTTLSSTPFIRGENVTFSTGNIVNSGSADADPYPISGFFIDSNGDGIADYLVATGNILATPIGESNSVSATWNIPVDAPLGIYRVGYIVNEPESFEEITRENNWSGWTEFIVESPAGISNLKPVGNPEHQSGSLVQGNEVTFRGQVENIGTAATESEFKNNFSYRWSVSDPWIDLTPFVDKDILGAGASSVVDVSPSLILSNNGTLYIQYCVDSMNEIGELNESDNCSVSSFVVTSPPAATISGVSCTIPDGGSSCEGEVTWEILNASIPNVHNELTSSNVSNNPIGNNVSITLNHGNNELQARDGDFVIDSVLLDVACENAPGYIFHSGSCIPNPPPPPAISLSIDRNFVRSGETATTTFTVVADYHVTCNVLGVRDTVYTFNHVGSPTETTVEIIQTRPLTAKQKITMTCNPSPFIPGVPTVQEVIEVNVVGNRYEI